MKSIRFKITFGIICILGLMLFILGYIAINSQRVKSLSQISEYGRETAEFIAQISVTPIRKFSFFQLEDYASRMEEGRIIAFCEIYDSKGNALTYNVNNRFSRAQSPPEDDILVFIANIDDEGMHLGRVELGVDLKPTLSEINTTSHFIIASLLITLLLIWFTLSYFINRSLVSPILKLANTTGTIAKGFFITSELAGQKDEVGVLAKSINSMSGSLDELYDTLEQKVVERTAALTASKNASEETAHNLKIVTNELQVLLDGSPVAIIFVNQDRVIQRVNLEFLKIFGYSPEDVIGKSTRILYGDDQTFSETGKTTHNILEHNEYCHVTAVMQRKDLTPITCSLRGRFTLMDNNNKGIIWTAEDISTKLRMEEEVIKVKKLESIGVLAGGIAHDFNNILVVILGNISLAEKMAADNPKVIELLDKSKKASIRAKNLTTKLLTFAKGGDPVKSVESLPEIIHDSASFTLSGSNVQCSYDIAEDLWAIRIDKGQMNQVIQNLILNADQAMPAGGTITITCRNIFLTGSTLPGMKEGDYVRMDISDTGSGIREDVIEKIFDPYFSTKEKGSDKGSGLGLSIVHSIVTKHGGSISVRSSLGAGTTFTMYLPATQEPAEQQQEQETILPQGSGKILLMDDDETIHAVTKEMFSYLGYESVHVNNGDEAIALYKDDLAGSRSIDIIIMDLTIPGGMGGDVAVKKVLKLNPKAKVIVSSGYSEDPIVHNFREAGFISTISKPYQLLELSKVLSETMAV